jgi:hypothetical protein
MAMDSASMARMDSLTTKLDSLRRVMNGASGARKTAAMAAMLDAMVEHHLEMRREMQRKMDDRSGGAMGGMAQPGCDKMGGAAADSAPAGGPQQHQHQHQ